MASMEDQWRAREFGGKRQELPASDTTEEVSTFFKLLAVHTSWQAPLREY